MTEHIIDAVDHGCEYPVKASRQARVLAVFGFATVTAAACHYQSRWDRDHPEEPLNRDALLHGLRADMNFSLPEPFTIESPAADYVTGPDLPHLPIGWAITARNKFKDMDLHLEQYTESRVQASLAKGQGGHPWTPHPIEGNHA